jgi:hypothetical protein
MRLPDSPFLTSGSSSSMDLKSCCDVPMQKTSTKKQPAGKKSAEGMLKASEKNKFYGSMGNKSGKKNNLKLPTGGANKMVGK